MIIAMPVEDRNENSNVNVSFGRAEGFMLLDSDTKKNEYLDNQAKLSQGGAGIKAAQILVDSHVDVLLTPRLGQNAADVLKAANIKIYKTEGISSKDNFNNYLDGKLNTLDKIHAGFHNHGGE